MPKTPTRPSAFTLDMKVREKAQSDLRKRINDALAGAYAVAGEVKDQQTKSAIEQAFTQQASVIYHALIKKAEEDAVKDFIEKAYAIHAAYEAAT